MMTNLIQLTLRIFNRYTLLVKRYQKQSIVNCFQQTFSLMWQIYTYSFKPTSYLALFS